MVDWEFCVWKVKSAVHDVAVHLGRMVVTALVAVVFRLSAPGTDGIQASYAVGKSSRIIIAEILIISVLLVQRVNYPPNKHYKKSGKKQENQQDLF